MPETPRTWTLSGARWDAPVVIEGPRLDKETKVVIEKAPVDAERERMLDLIEALMVGAPLDDGSRSSALALLHEHNRHPPWGGPS